MNQFFIGLALVGTVLTMPIADHSDANLTNPIVMPDYSSIVKVDHTPAPTISVESSEINTSISIEISSEGQPLQNMFTKLEKNEKTTEVSQEEEVIEKQENKRDVAAYENASVSIPKVSTNSGQLSDIASQLPVLETMKFDNSAKLVAVEKIIALPTLETDNSAETLPVALSVVKPKNKTLDQTLAELNKEATHVPQNVEVDSSIEADNQKKIRVKQIIESKSEVLPKDEEENLEHKVAHRVTSDEKIVENKHEDKKDAFLKQEEKKEERIEPEATEDQQRVVRETELFEEKSEKKITEKEKKKRDKNVSADSSSQESRQEEKAQVESKEEIKSMESESAEKLEAVVREVPVVKLEDTVVVENKKDDSSSSSSESF